MGMPVKIDLVDNQATQKDIEEIFSYFSYIEEKFSPFKETSETCRFNRGEIKENELSPEMREVLTLSQQTKQDTNGYFNIEIGEGKINPVGLVKGWAIYNAAKILQNKGYKNFYLDIGGDIQAQGLNHEGKKWSIGIRNPFSNEPDQAIVKVIYLSDQGIATSGNYIRGNHIYNPKDHTDTLAELMSFSVIGPNVYEADRFATAAFAMGKQGINFIEQLSGFEGYMIDSRAIATMTSKFENYTK